MATDNIYKQVQDTLNSIDGTTRAEVPPFFYTRLQAKLTNHQANTWWQILFTIVTKPTFAVATVSLFAMLNITAITVNIKDKQQSNITSESTTIQGFAQEYNLSTTTVYTDK
jgi:hypothetical protein